MLEMSTSSDCSSTAALAGFCNFHCSLTVSAEDECIDFSMFAPETTNTGWDDVLLARAVEAVTSTTQAGGAFGTLNCDEETSMVNVKVWYVLLDA